MICGHSLFDLQEVHENPEYESLYRAKQATPTSRVVGVYIAKYREYVCSNVRDHAVHGVLHPKVF